MKRAFPTRFTILLVGTLLLMAIVAAAQSDFTIIVLPDTQLYSESYPSIFTAQTQWIAANKSALNIQAVIGVGDIVEHGLSTTEWHNADAAVRVLDTAGIPYFLAIGNHDYQSTNTTNPPRSALNFDTYFGPLRYSGYPWYSGNLDGSNQNFYGVVSINNERYLILALEFVPRNSTLTWAENIISANPDKKVIIVTHSNMALDNTRVDQCDTTNLNNDNDGEEMWQKLTSRYSNVMMVLSGHLFVNGGTAAARRIDLGWNGNLVFQLQADEQGMINGGNGYLRIMTLRPALKQIVVKTYSPYLNTYLTDAKNQFTLSLNPGTTSGTATIGGKVKVARIGSTQDCKALTGVSVSTAGASAQTSTAGTYSLLVTAPAAYSVTVSAPNWVSQTVDTPAWARFPASVNFFMIPNRGTISGKVTNAVTGLPISGATVQVTGGVVGFNKKLTSNSSGVFSSGLISVGGYTVTVSKAGYTTQTATTSVSDSTTTTLNFKM